MEEINYIQKIEGLADKYLTRSNMISVVNKVTRNEKFSIEFLYIID